ncbi:MAG: STAS domain-containing protein [Calditrichae bacterium]|nr:STAS domain-containing protein [Calditrichota bacterium]MCB9058022.1 STAS domain-containing protein [Calditrichia bacterium]
MMHFVENKFDKIMVLTVKGNLVQKEETDKLQARILGILEKKLNNVVIDLKNVSMITSLGIGGIIRALRTIRDEKGEMKLSGVNESVKKVLEITKLSEIIEIFDTVDEAVKSFS